MVSEGYFPSAAFRVTLVACVLCASPRSPRMYIRDGDVPRPSPGITLLPVPFFFYDIHVSSRELNEKTSPVFQQQRAITASKFAAAISDNFPALRSVLTGSDGAANASAINAPARRERHINYANVINRNSPPLSFPFARRMYTSDFPRTPASNPSRSFFQQGSSADGQRMEKQNRASGRSGTERGEKGG